MPSTDELRPAHELMYCVIDGAAGRYVPQRFAEQYALPDTHREVLLHGPNADDVPRETLEAWFYSTDPDDIEAARARWSEIYWETWADVLDFWTVEDEAWGCDAWFMQRSGDVFAVRSDITDEEAEHYLQ